MAFYLSLHYRAAAGRRFETRWQSHLCRKGKLTVMTDGVTTGSVLPMYERNYCNEQIHAGANQLAIRRTHIHEVNSYCLQGDPF